jgi:hypothetical protein
MFSLLYCAGNFSAAEAPRTDVNMAVRAVNYCLNTLYITFPSTVGSSVRMAHLNTERNALAAKFTLCHLLHLLAMN